MDPDLDRIREIILEAGEKARGETAHVPLPEVPRRASWPISCTVGPGLEGAIACESKVGYVNATKGWLVYRGYDIFDLCAHSTFEEVCYLLLHGALPKPAKLAAYKKKLNTYGSLDKTLRLLMGFPVETMHVMGALRLGTNMMRQEFTLLDRRESRPDYRWAIAADEDSMGMETPPKGEDHAIYEFYSGARNRRKSPTSAQYYQSRAGDAAVGLEACYHLIAGVSTIIAAICRITQHKLPISPDPELGHAANLLYMISGSKPTPIEERIMDICLILHADHGMNASTFAAMVVASTLADIYFSIGAGIGALSGPLHGGANEAVINNLREIGSVENVRSWIEKKLAAGERVSGFGHRVYKAYDPRARILGPLAGFLVKGRPAQERLFQVALELEHVMLSEIGRKKKIFPNVDFYSGIVYDCLGIDSNFYTAMFAASRVSGWTARILEYMSQNRIFRPRGLYVGEFRKIYTPIDQR